MKIKCGRCGADVRIDETKPIDSIGNLMAHRGNCDGNTTHRVYVILQDESLNYIAISMPSSIHSNLYLANYKLENPNE